MFRTFSCALSLTGITVIKQQRNNPFVVHAAETQVSNNKPWMAEPLTEESTRLKNKDSMRTRMELMILKVGGFLKL